MTRFRAFAIHLTASVTIFLVFLGILFFVWYQRRQELLFGVLLEGQKDLEFRAEFYEPYRPDLAHLRARSVDLAKMAALDPDAKLAIDSFVAKQSGRMEDFLFLPLKGNNKDIVMALSAKDGMPAGWISISPWLGDYRDAR